MLQAETGGIQSHILNGGFNGKDGAGEIPFGEVRMDEGTERSYTQRGSLVQPYMTVDSGSFIEPALFRAGIRPDADKILSAIVEVFRDVINLCGIAAWLAAEVEPVQPYSGITENPVELQPDMPALVFFWNVERLSVPAHTGVRIFVAHGFVAMAVACQRVERELRDPVVGKVHLLPGTCIEFG